MKYLYVAWQNEDSREWIPVAKLEQVEKGYRLTYTNGARRCPGFSGLGRMSALDKVYYSNELFPFFSNRMIGKSRPEYKKYLQWLDLDNFDGDPMSVMGVTGGLRATDSFELIPQPRLVDGKMTLNFFPKGVRHLAFSALEEIDKLQVGAKLCLMCDIQNSSDPKALALRSEEQKIIVGYIARYYCDGLGGLLVANPGEVEVKVVRVNKDAPADMRLLCSLTFPSHGNEFQLLTL
jgi:hypothetical protein